MPTVTLRDPKVPLDLPEELSKDGGEEVMNFKPFKVGLALPPLTWFPNDSPKLCV